MTGYYNKPEATADAIKDGWFHTGDIGSLDAEGYLRITDRKKDLLVTSGGKKIAPQPIENVLKQSPLVAEAVVLGDRRKYAAALIVPEFAALERRLRDLGRTPSPHAGPVPPNAPSWWSGPTSRALYQEIVDALNRELSQFERIKRIAILPREFSIETGELTPTLKVKRKVVEEKWAAEIEGLYGELDRLPSSNAPIADFETAPSACSAANFTGAQRGNGENRKFGFSELRPPD